METTAYKMAYLVGVSEKVLEREYPEEYRVSNQSGYFGNYPGAVELRTLSSLRQSVLRYTYLYKNKRQSVDAKTKGYYTNEIEKLKNVGIDIERLFKENNLVDYVNTITILIEGLKEDVLTRLGVPRADVMKEYLFFPLFKSDEALLSFIEDRAENVKVHGVMFYYGDRIEPTVAFCLKSDKNALYSVHSMLGKKYDNGVDLEQEYEWVKRMATEDIRKDVERLLESMKEGSLARDGIRETQSVVKVQDGTSLTNFLTEEVEIFVDCDNSDFFKVINFIKEIEQKGKKSSIRKVKLIVDKKSNFLWKVFKTIYTGDIDVEIVQVSRIKDTKSVADIVLTKEICESYYTKGLRKAVVMSSDSDFYGVITSIPEIDYCVCYVESQTHDGYLDYLEDAGITTYNLAGVKTEEYIERYKGLCIEYLLGYVMALTPMVKWNDPTLTDSVIYHMNREADETISREYIEQRVEELKADAEVRHIDGEAYIKVGSIEINTAQI